MIYIFVGQFVDFRDWKRHAPLRWEDSAIHFLGPAQVRGLRGKAKLIVGRGAMPKRVSEAQGLVDLMNASWRSEVDVPF